MSAGHVQQPPTAARRGPAGRAVRRSWADLGTLAAAVVALLLASAAAWDRSVPGWERTAFAAVNDPSPLPFALVWPVMQLGNVGVVVVAAAVAAVRRRLRLASQLLVGGLAAYLLARAVKAVVARPRPPALLEDVSVRGPQVVDLGFVSGHATVATVVAVLLLPWVAAGTRWLLVGLALAVCLARVHVGAHLPLDVLGGAALAVAVAAATWLVLGRPASAATPTPRRGRGGALRRGQGARCSTNQSRAAACEIEAPAT